MTPKIAAPHPVTAGLLRWVQHTVDHLCGSTEGLSETQLHLLAAPSGWTVAGLLFHIGESTRFWSHHVIGGHPTALDDDLGATWPVGSGTLTERIARLREQVRIDVAAVAHLSPDAAPAWWPEGAWGGYHQETARAVLLHLLHDNAAHTGHLDLARERLDGAVWDLATDTVRRPVRI